ncbi:MAG TPA: phenylalanine--tRNA ligase subunit beta [Thermoanaerobaculia bacterium]|nr:phenylalanine--tRNA ligase subunit beta [Thermoanaerobaculia bacterium]
MKISREWLGDYVDLTDLSDTEIAEKLTSIGHAVEAIEQHEGIGVFEIEFTTNRVDAMSHLGLARELAAAFGRELLTGTYEVESSTTDPAVESVPISIDAPELCSRYTGLVIEGVTVRPSSHHVRSRLESVGLRPINNIVDVTNYIMTAVGHPLHAFDRDRLAGPEIRVRRGLAKENIKTLDGQERSADEGTVVIADAARGVAFGGVMGGFDSEITDSTRNVLLECAHFAPSSIRGTSRRLGLKTDASYRFERGADPDDTVAAIEQAAQILLREAGGRRGAVIDVIAQPATPRTIVLRTSTLEQASAGRIGMGYAITLFARLGMNPRTTAEGVEVAVPGYRGDLAEETDLIEEVLRFYGFDHLPAVLPRVTSGDVRRDVILELEETIRGLLAGSGLAEVINYSFIQPSRNSDFSDESPLGIANALTENIASMRLSLLPGLLENVAFNLSYGTRDGGIFEVGRTYHASAHEVTEVPRAAIAMFGSTPSHWGDPRRLFDYFDVKGVIEIILKRLHVDGRFSQAELPWMRRGKGAAVHAGDARIGYVGVIAPEVSRRFEIKGEVMVAELDLHGVAASRKDWKMKPVSRFPGIPMVLSLVHAPSLSVEQVLEKVRSLEVPYLEEVGVRDRYVPESGNEVKTTLGMWYQAADQSLAQDQVAEIHQRLAVRIGEMLPVKIQ